MKQLLLTIMAPMALLILSACTSDAAGFDFGQPTPTPAKTPTALPTPIKIFQSTISADGDIVLPLPPQTLSLQSSGMSGTLTDVYVVPGQAVEKGDPLAQIDNTDLLLALRKAEAALSRTEAQITSEAAPALSGDIAEAQANLEAALTDLDRLKSLPQEETITQAAADLRLREVELRQAQEAYDAVAYAQGIGMSPQAAELQTATLNYERAQAIYNDAIKPASDAELANAQAKVVQTKNALEKLLSELRPEVKAVNQAKLDEAQLNVDEARLNLSRALLLAPWDGIITEVNGAPGISTSNASVTIAQAAPLRFATNNLSERNLNDIKVGDEAIIYLKSYPNVPFPAVIQRIEFESTRKDGDTALFSVYLDFNSGDYSIRPGMTGRVEITIEPLS